MRKRISCKVIRTIPLRTRFDELRSRGRSNDTPHNINNTSRPTKTNKFVRGASTNPRVKDISKSVIYTGRLDITRIPIDNGLTTLTLNFYA
jgi:hypothetical protein